MTPRQSTLLLRVAKMLDGYVPGSLPGNGRKKDRMSEVTKTTNHKGTATRYFCNGVSVVVPRLQLDEPRLDLGRRGIDLNHARLFAAAILAVCDAVDKAGEGQ